MKQQYEGLTDQEYQTLQEIKNWGLNQNRSNRQKSLDLGIEFL